MHFGSFRFLLVLGILIAQRSSNSDSDYDEEDLDWVEDWEDLPEFGNDLVPSEFVEWELEDYISSEKAANEAVFIIEHGEEYYIDSAESLAFETTFKLNASLQRAPTKFLHSKTVLNITQFPKFAGVSEKSLLKFLRSTWGICSLYKNVQTNETRYFQGTAVLINKTHVLTVRHNVYDCVTYTSKQNVFGSFSMKPCKPSDYNCDERYELIHVTFDLENGECGYHHHTPPSKVTRPRKDTRNFDGYFLGPKIDGTYTYDLALVEIDKSTQYLISQQPEEYEYVNLEIIDLNEIGMLKDKRIINVGMGLPFMDKIGKERIIQLNDRPESQVKLSKIYEYFGHGRKTYSISDKFEFGIDGTSKYLKHRLNHHLPSWQSYSGSPIAWVDKKGMLHPFALHSGTGNEVNVAIMSSHRFLVKIIKENEHLNSKPEKQEL